MLEKLIVYIYFYKAFLDLSGLCHFNNNCFFNAKKFTPVDLAIEVMTQKKKVWATGSCSASPLGLIGERDYSPLG